MSMTSEPVLAQDSAAAADGPAVEDAGLKNLIMTTRDLPAMPHIASKVLELSSDPEACAPQLQQVIADDQAMAARILKIANSAMYSCSRQVKTLSEAIVMLGFNSIRSLVVASAARNLYAGSGSRLGLKERLLWEHSIGCAFAGRVLAMRRWPLMAEEAFLAGLMHDIGKLVLNLQIPERFDEVVQVVYNEHRGFCETERELLGFDHAQVGALLVNKWKLTPLLEETIGLHHDVQAVTADRPLLLCLDAANQLCHRLGIGFKDDPDLDLLAQPSVRQLGFSAAEIDELAGKLQESLEQEMEIFI